MRSILYYEMHQLRQQPYQDLVAAANAGDGRAFDELARRYRHGIYALCLDRMADFDVAEDLTQEAIVQAYAELHTLRDVRAFPGWLRQIARNCCRMWHRRRPQNNRHCLPPVPALTEDTFEAAARREAARGIRSALAHLPENNRLSLIMFYLRGDTYRGIAEFLGVPETTVVGRLHRARDQLRRVLKARMGEYLANIAQEWPCEKEGDYKWSGK